MRPTDSVGLEGLVGPQSASTAGPSPTPSGLVSELSGRAGREVEAWIAVPGSADATEVLGLATLVTSTGRARLRRSIAWLLVHPSARRRGIGRALVETICHEASTRDQAELWVECHTQWQIAMAFWRSVGFVARG